MVKPTETKRVPGGDIAGGTKEQGCFLVLSRRTYMRKEIQVIVNELIEWLGETAEAPKP